MDFVVNLAGNVSQKALQDARSVDALTASLSASQTALKTANAARTKAPPKASEVRPFKPSLDAYRGTATAVNAATKAQKGFFGVLAESNGPIGGLVKDARKAWEALRENPSAAVAAGFALIGVGAISLGAKLLSLAKDAALFAFSAGDAARSARLLNNAADLAGGGSQQLTLVVAQLARAVPVGKEKLAEMGRELRRMRFTGREAQLALSASAYATSALGDAAGSAVRGIAESSKAMRRFTIGTRDLYGEYTELKKVGLTKGDLFTALSGQLGVGVGEVQQRLLEGRISVRQGLQGIDAALQKKFGKTVSAQLLSVDTQFSKMKEDFLDLFSGTDIDPFLKSLKQITSIFSQDTASGRAFKSLTGAIFGDLAKLAETQAPKIRAFIFELSEGAAKPGGLSDVIRGWIKDAQDFAKSLEGIADSIKTIASGVKTTGHVISAITSPIDTAKKDVASSDEAKFQRAFTGKYTAAEATADAVKLTAGISTGIQVGTPDAVNAMQQLAFKLRESFNAANQAKSPARAYIPSGRNIDAGIEAGVRGGIPNVQGAMVDVAGAMKGSFDGASFGGTISNSKSSTRSITNNISVKIMSPDGDFIGREVVRRIVEASDSGAVQ